LALYTARMFRYAITNRVATVGDQGNETALPDGSARLLEQVHGWAAKDVEFVQLREKGLAAADLLKLAKAVLRARDAGWAKSEGDRGDRGRTRVLIASSLDAAVAARADGVHLPGSWFLPEAGGLGRQVDAIRRRYEQAGLDEPRVSISCHAVEEVQVAGAAGVDVVLFGPVFGKVVGGETVLSGVGLGMVGEACEAAAGVPVLALGGVTWENAEECLRAGAAGVAGIRLFWEAGGPRT